MAESLRDWREAMVYAQGQSRHATPPSPYRDWEGKCQMFCRFCYGIGPGFGSAYLQWKGLDPEDRHVGGSPSDAPVGAMLFSKGSNPFGHIWMAARSFNSGTPGSWGTDMVRTGQVDKHARTAPMSAWGHTYLGYGTAVNGVDLRVKENKPPKPKQDKPYERIKHMIESMEFCLEVAKKEKDWADAKEFRAEIHRLEEMYAELRRS